MLNIYDQRVLRNISISLNLRGAPSCWGVEGNKTHHAAACTSSRLSDPLNAWRRSFPWRNKSEWEKSRGAFRALAYRSRRVTATSDPFRGSKYSCRVALLPHVSAGGAPAATSALPPHISQKYIFPPFPLSLLNMCERSQLFVCPIDRPADQSGNIWSTESDWTLPPPPPSTPPPLPHLTTINQTVTAGRKSRHARNNRLWRNKPSQVLATSLEPASAAGFVLWI